MNLHNLTSFTDKDEGVLENKPAAGTISSRRCPHRGRVG